MSSINYENEVWLFCDTLYTNRPKHLTVLHYMIKIGNTTQQHKTRSCCEVQHLCLITTRILIHRNCPICAAGTEQICALEKKTRYSEMYISLRTPGVFEKLFKGPFIIHSKRTSSTETFYSCRLLRTSNEIKCNLEEYHVFAFD